MKRLTLAAALVFAATAAAADPLEGTWKTAPDDNGKYGHVEVKPCGDAFCGVLVRAYDSSGKEVASDNIGKRIIWDMVAQGGGAYGKGKIWSPDRNKTYASKMELNGDALAVSGCILVICRDGGTWQRVK